MRAVDAIVERLVNEGVGVAGVTIFVGNDSDLPSGGAPFLTIFETGGREPLGTHNTGRTAYRRPGFQVVARAHDYNDAGLLADAAYNALTNVVNVTIAGFRFLSIAPVQEPFSMPTDVNGRARVVFNIATHRQG